MNKRIPLIALIILVLFSSCKKDIVAFKSKKKGFDVEEINFDYFHSKTKVRYAEGDKQVNGNANIRIKKDSLIWISVSPSIGIEATRMLISKDTAIIINRMDKEYYVFNFQEISRYFNFKVDFGKSLPTQSMAIETASDISAISRKCCGFQSVKWQIVLTSLSILSIISGFLSRR